MLVLSRRPGETIKIGDDVDVMVVRLEGDKVKLGISAPRTTVVLRQELSASACANCSNNMPTGGTCPSCGHVDDWDAGCECTACVMESVFTLPGGRNNHTIGVSDGDRN